MKLTVAEVKSASSELVANLKTWVTVAGAVLAAATEVLPVVPAQWQHWAVGAIAVGTVFVRDVSDALTKAP